MTLNEIASYLHREYDIPYRKALSIAAKLIKQGAYEQAPEETKKQAESEAGIEVETIEWENADDSTEDDIFGEAPEYNDEEALSKLNKRMDAIGKSYMGEAGLLGLMAGVISEIEAIALEDSSALEILQKLDKAGYNDEWFEGLFAPSDEAWAYRDSNGRIKLDSWIHEIESMMKVLGIPASESLYLSAVKRYRGH